MDKFAVERQQHLKVFISYSRLDLQFADRLVDALQERNISPIIDTRDLPAFEDWQRELLQFIREADAVVFVVSPRSVASPVCAWEIEQVKTLNKRLAPVVIEQVDNDRIPEAIAKLNYLFFDDPNFFDSQVDKLASGLQLDLEWVKNHTRLSELARRWNDRSRSNSLALRGDELQEAERWIASHPRGAPDATALQRAYIIESRRAATRRARSVTGASLLAGGAALALAMFAFAQQRKAEKSEVVALQTAATSDFQRGATLLLQPETTSEGIALLSRAVRIASDERAITRLWSLVQQRQFWVPRAGPPVNVNPLVARIPSSEEEAIKTRISRLAFVGLPDVAHTFISVSADMARVFTGVAGSGTDPRYRIWNADGTPVTEWREPRYTGGNWIYALKGYLSPNGSFLALVIDGWREASVLQAVDLASNTQVGQLTAEGLWPPLQNAGFSTVTFFTKSDPDIGDKLFLLAASEKGDAAIYSVDHRSLTRVALNRHSEPIVFANFDDQKEWLLSAAQDGTIRISRSGDGAALGNILQVDGGIASVARTAGAEIQVVLNDGRHQRFGLVGPWRFGFKETASQKPVATLCGSWDPIGMDAPVEETGLVTPTGTLSLVNKRQLVVNRGTREIALSPLFTSDIALVCASDWGDFAVTTKSFVTEVWSADFKRRYGTSINERPLFKPDGAPQTTNMTVTSKSRNILLVRSYFFDPPEYGHLWYSAWDLKTSTPLIDRVETFDSLAPFVGIAFRLSHDERYLIFADGLHNNDGELVSWIELRPTQEVGAWLPDFAEALIDARLSVNGVAESVANREEAIADGVRRLDSLAVK